MNTTSIKPEDMVRCDVRGHQFYGIVKDKEDGAITVHPVSPGCGSYDRTVSSRQVIAHFRKSKQSRG